MKASHAGLGQAWAVPWGVRGSPLDFSAGVRSSDQQASAPDRAYSHHPIRTLPCRVAILIFSVSTVISLFVPLEISIGI